MDPEKFLYGAENKRVDLENIKRNYKLGVDRQHRIYRNISDTKIKMLYSTVKGGWYLLFSPYLV